MTAEEYFKEKFGHTYVVQFNSISMIKFAEDYYQAKSHEEAVERYVGAKRSMDKLLSTSFASVELECLINGHLIFASGFTSCLAMRFE